MFPAHRRERHRDLMTYEDDPAWPRRLLLGYRPTKA
jgi:hypothetical protein